MKILVITDPQNPVPPSHYGGTERIVAYLCAELQRLGHQVDIMAGPGSEEFGGRLIVHQAPSISYLSRAFRKLWFRWISARAAVGADAIINFGRLDYLGAIFPLSSPLVCVFENPVRQDEINWLLARRKSNLYLIGISRNQIESLRPQNLWHIVPNATDTTRFKFSQGPADEPYLAFLGRITFNKGADTAIRVAKQSGMKLKLAGNISDEENGREFFEREIRPQLTDQIEWLGPVDDTQKQALLGGAAALLFPIRWQEPFGIVMVESLACGTPVIATRCASTPEVIDDGKTGFLCDSEEEMLGAIGKISSLDRARCREVVEERFSISVMTRGYLHVINRTKEAVDSVE